jgi:hypothetical protein
MTNQEILADILNSVKKSNTTKRFVKYYYVIYGVADNGRNEPLCECDNLKQVKNVINRMKKHDYLIKMIDEITGKQEEISLAIF